jgi:hypothetical protein
MAEFSTPDQDKIIGELRQRLVGLIAQAGLDGYDHSLMLTALMLVTSAGAVSTGKVTREESSR